MTVVSALTRAVAFLAFIAGPCPVATAQLSIGGHQAPIPPTKKRLTTPSAKPRTAPATDEHGRLADMFNRMTPKERKQFAKAWKHMTPEQQNQVAASLKRQLSGNKKTPAGRF